MMDEETREQIIKRLWEETRHTAFSHGAPSWIVADLPKIKPSSWDSLDHSAPMNFDPMRTYEFRKGVEYNHAEGLKRYFVECEGVRVAEEIRPLA